MTLPQSKQIINRTMLMKRHQRIAPLFVDDFLGYALTKSEGLGCGLIIAQFIAAR